jgi:signal transduction histidine kinase
VQELGGRILVESTPGVGTRIRILLPLCEPSTSAAQHEAREAAA